VKRRIWIAVALWAVTSVVGALALLLPNFGASAWVVVPCFLWLFTVGFPTTAGVLVTASIVTGWPLAVFVVVACTAGLVLQILAVQWVLGRDVGSESEA